MSDLKSGDKVVWKIGRIEFKGVYTGTKRGCYSVIKCHFMGDKPATCSLKVQSDLLKKEDWNKTKKIKNKKYEV